MHSTELTKKIPGWSPKLTGCIFDARPAFWEFSTGPGSRVDEFAVVHWVLKHTPLNYFTFSKCFIYVKNSSWFRRKSLHSFSPPCGGGVLGSIFAAYLPLASQNPYPIIVYSVVNYSPHLNHFLRCPFCQMIFSLSKSRKSATHYSNPRGVTRSIHDRWGVRRILEGGLKIYTLGPRYFFGPRDLSRIFF